MILDGDYMTTDPSTLPSRPSWDEWNGHVYIVEFGNGTIKIGSTNNARQRIAAHGSTAACFGVTLTRCWVSRRWAGYVGGEKLLLAEAKKLGGTVTSREWFQGLDFDHLVAIAPEFTYSNPGGVVLRRKAAARKAANENPHTAWRCHRTGLEPDRLYTIPELAAATGTDEAIVQSYFPHWMKTITGMQWMWVLDMPRSRRDAA